MNILMMTNTYLPHVGGVARSIESFSAEYRNRGHEVKIVAPEFDGMADDETDIIRIPAVRNFNQSDFSLALPIPGVLTSKLANYDADIVHSHHPFLVGATALRYAHTNKLPLVFTHHTKYEDYTHNVPGDFPTIKIFVKEIASNYANTCDLVFAPSESIATLIRGREVTTPVTVVPTGVNIDHFCKGDGTAMREKLGIPQDAFVIGHLGRLCKEKNLDFLADALIRLLQTSNKASKICVAVFGSGPLQKNIVARFGTENLQDRLFMGGVVKDENLVNAFHCMDAFVFSSLSETQGMVLTEAMACGIPVIAIDAPGVREVVSDQVNGRKLMSTDIDEFARAIDWIIQLDDNQYGLLVDNARETAQRFSMQVSADKALDQYTRLLESEHEYRDPDFSIWSEALIAFESEWLILRNTFKAAADTLVD